MTKSLVMIPGTTGGKPLPGVGHRVSKIDIHTRMITIFVINKSGFAATYTGRGGFERSIDVVFGRDEAMYVADFGWPVPGESGGWLPETGVIWRITRVK